jgi:CubicO group peptidase (beta-lactamase class C family)
MNTTAVLIGTLLFATQPAKAPAITEIGRTVIDTFLRSEVDTGHVPGVVAIVVSRDAVIYSGAFGKQCAADNVAMRENTIFQIASMTKPITSVAVMRLVEDGKVCLDDPVSKYIPSLAQPRVIASVNAATGEYTTRPTSEITIRQLLCHTSGVGYEFCNHTLHFLQEKTGKDSRDLPLLHDPGQRWTYGMGTQVLGEVVEAVSHQTLDQYLQDTILGPLEMVDTTFALPQGKLQRLVTIHHYPDGKLTEIPNPPSDAKVVRGDYGLRSTARDYTRFLQMLLGGGQLGKVRILNAESVTMMTTNQIGNLVIELQPAELPAVAQAFPLGAGRDKFGLGFQVAVVNEPQPHLRSAGSFSWGGIYNTHFWADPQQGIAAVLLMQVLPYYDRRCVDVLTGFEQRVYDNLR